MQPTKAPGNIISNAFMTTTRVGKNVFRIKVDNGKFLSYLEEGKTHMAIDICCNGKTPRVVAGNSKKSGRHWEALQYYVWAMEPSEALPPKGVTNGGVSTGDVPKQ